MQEIDLGWIELPDGSLHRVVSVRFQARGFVAQIRLADRHVTTIYGQSARELQRRLRERAVPLRAIAAVTRGYVYTPHQRRLDEAA